MRYLSAVQSAAMLLRQRPWPLHAELWSIDDEWGAATREALTAAAQARPMLLLTGSVSTDAVVAHAALRTDAHDAAWGAASLVLSFVRAQPLHPFMRSVVPLIPTVMALADRALFSESSEPCGLLISSIFGRSHWVGRGADKEASASTSASASPAPRAAAMAAGLHDADHIGGGGSDGVGGSGVGRRRTRASASAAASDADGDVLM